MGWEVHRDLKSLNIVLDLQYQAKICDFGLTQSMEKTHISLKEGANGGSPRYMAPECYDSKGKITEKVRGGTRRDGYVEVSDVAMLTGPH